MDSSDSILFSDCLPEPELSTYPFDHPQADLILRSSDTPPTDFRVFKLLLSLSSPFFSVLLTLPQPAAANVTSPLLSPPINFGTSIAAAHSPQPAAPDDEGLPVIQMAEDKRTLSTLLGFCYPISVQELPRFGTFAELQSVLEAALKFEMEGVVNRVRKNEFVSPRFLEAQPVRVFAAAFAYGWMEEATLAARYTLRHPMPGPYAEELERIPAGAYSRLQEYHRKCGDVARACALEQEKLAMDEYEEDPDDCPYVWSHCKRCPPSVVGGRRPSMLSSYVRGRREATVRRWWADWVKEVGRLLQTRPRGETVRNVDLARNAIALANKCSICSVTAREDLEGFMQELSARVEREIAKVQLDVFPDVTTR